MSPSTRRSTGGLGPGIKAIPPLRERLERLGVTWFADVTMAEEQEREVNCEVDLERRALPEKAVPEMHRVHDEIRDFACTGILPMQSTYIFPLLTSTGIDMALNSMQMWSP